MKKYRIERLEQTLQYLEEMAYLEATTIRITEGVSSRIGSPSKDTINGILKNYREFRDALLHAAHTPFDFERFGYSTKVENPGLYKLLIIKLAVHLYAWSRYSRRVFHITDDLRILLEATRFPDYDLKDIPWPFDAFAVTFESPLPMASIEDGEESYSDLVLFTQKDSFDKDGVQTQLFSCIPTSLGSYTFIDESIRNTINTKIQKGLHDDAFSDIADIRDAHYEANTTVVSVPYRMNQRVSIFGLAAKDQESERGVLNIQRVNRIVKLVCCFVLYLTTLSPQSPAVKTLKVGNPPTTRRRVTIDGAIRNGMEVCEVTCNTSISSEELRDIRDVVESGILRGVRGTMPPHFREGYFSRPAGRGNDPNVPRTIWHRPTFVNRDLLTPGTLPGGKRDIVE